MNQSSEAINKVSKCYYYATLAAITAPSSGRRLHRSFFLLHVYYIHRQNNKRTQKQRIGIPSLEFSLVSKTATTHAPWSRLRRSRPPASRRGRRRRQQGGSVYVVGRPPPSGGKCTPMRSSDINAPPYAIASFVVRRSMSSSHIVGRVAGRRSESSMRSARPPSAAGAGDDDDDYQPDAPTAPPWPYAVPCGRCTRRRLRGRSPQLRQSERPAVSRTHTVPRRERRFIATCPVGRRPGWRCVPGRRCHLLRPL